MRGRVSATSREMKYTALLLIAALPGVVFGACPNACSGHGTCGEFDSCKCHSNFESSDCSQRICLYNWAWVTTPQGDLNFDGDLFDGTIYADDYEFKAGGATHYLATDAAPGGTWEYWPSFHSTTHDEGHFYMECSNRGICDRTTGTCKCFDGFEGSACRRMQCHNGCSGHGTCNTIEELLADFNDESGSSIEYNLWDKDMGRACRCDPGYESADCNDRVCPKGDDPLTKDGQLNDIQIVEIYATAMPPGEYLGGTFQATFTEENGAKWKTRDITVASFNGPSTASNLIVEDFKAALEELPGRVIDNVTVTGGFCELASNGVFSAYVAGTGATSPLIAAGNCVRCPAAVTGGAPSSYVVVDSTGLTVISNPLLAAEDATAVGAVHAGPTAADVSCLIIENCHCMRFYVDFSTNPGPQKTLSIDSTSVTLGGKTIEQEPTYGTTASVTKTIPITDGIGTVAYTAKSSMVTVSTDTTNTITGSTVSFVAVAASPGTFPANAVVEIICGTRSLGLYTASATSTAGADLIVNEKIIVDNNRCDGTIGDLVTAKLITDYIEVTTDVTTMDLVGKRISISAGVAAGEGEMLIVDSTQFNAVAGTGQIFLTSEADLETTFAATVATISINGVGTKEAAVCSGRGLCRSETGLCTCFKGYSGNACEIQNALSSQTGGL